MSLEPYSTIEARNNSGKSILQSLREKGLRSSTVLYANKLDDDYNMSIKNYQSIDMS